MINIVKFTQEIKPTHTNVVGGESMTAGHAMPISHIFLFCFFTTVFEIRENVHIQSREDQNVLKATASLHLEQCAP